jgi:hypothetical protein
MALYGNTMLITAFTGDCRGFLDSCVKIYILKPNFLKLSSYYPTPTRGFPEPAWRSRYSDWLWARRPRGWSLKPDMGKIFLLFILTGYVAHPASYPMVTRGGGGGFPGVKRPGRETYHSPPTSAEFKNYVDLYIHSPIRLRTLPFATPVSQVVSFRFSD